MIAVGLTVLLLLAVAIWLMITMLKWLVDFAEEPSLRKLLRTTYQVALFCWFAYWSWASVNTQFISGGKLGLDARIYFRGAQAWTQGADPWNATVAFPGYGFHFAAPPPSVLLFAPFTWLPEQAFVIGFTLLSVTAAFYSLHRARLPVWWIVFPPLLMGALSGNPVVIALACALSGSRWLAPLAAAAKIYAVAALVAERRWLALALVVVVLGATVALCWPLWHQYVTDYSSISATINRESAGGFSATRSAPLFVLTAAIVGLLAVVDFRSAVWLAVPALAPFTEFHTSVFALPVMSPVLAIGLALPQQGLAPAIICAYAAWRVGQKVVGRDGLGAPVPAPGDDLHPEAGVGPHVFV